jgi:hypothetical protein
MRIIASGMDRALDAASISRIYFAIYRVVCLFKNYRLREYDVGSSTHSDDFIPKQIISNSTTEMFGAKQSESRIVREKSCARL